MKRNYHFILLIALFIISCNEEQKTELSELNSVITHELEKSELKINNTTTDTVKIKDKIIKEDTKPMDTVLETITYTCDSGEIYAYLRDNDSNGTNLRNGPKGEIIYVLKTQYGFVDFTLSESINNWFKITNIYALDEEIEPIPNHCWIHGSLLGAHTRNYGGQTISIYENPDSTKVAFIINDVVGVSLNAMCGNNWVQINHKGKLGWIQSEWLCGNPVTTCP